MLKVTLRGSKTNSVRHEPQRCREGGRQPGSLRRLPSEYCACWKERSPPAMARSSHHEHPVGYYPLITSYPTAVCSRGTVLGLPSKAHGVFTSSHHLIHHSQVCNYQHVYTVITCVPACYLLTGMALLPAGFSQSCLHQIGTRLGTTPINQTDLELYKGQVKAS